MRKRYGETEREGSGGIGRFSPAVSQSSNTKGTSISGAISNLSKLWCQIAEKSSVRQVIDYLVPTSICDFINSTGCDNACHEDGYVDE